MPEYKNYPPLYHSHLVKNGPSTMKILHAPKSGERQAGGMWRKCQIEASDGEEYTFWLDNKAIQDMLAGYVGQTITVVAKGGGKGQEETSTLEIAGQGAATSAPSQSAAPAKQTNSGTKPTARDCKVFLSQATNLMRICVKKANDIAGEMNLPAEHRQGIASTLFIESKGRGFVEAMPLDPYTPEEIGYTDACKAFTPKAPDPRHKGDPEYSEPLPEDRRDAEDDSDSLPF